MFQILKKKLLFITGVLFTGVLSTLSFLLNGHSKDDSLFVSTASADIASWEGTVADSGGSGCGGCSGAGGDSAAGGGGG